MVNSCSAFGCTNRQSRGSGLQFHRFPLNRPEVLKKWVKAVLRINFTPTKYSYLCSDHFLSTDYQIRPGASYRWLKEDAFPSVLKEFPDHLQKPIPTKRRFLPRIIKKEKKLKIPRLTDDAIPTIFPKYPNDSRKGRKKRKTLEEMNTCIKKEKDEVEIRKESKSDALVRPVETNSLQDLFEDADMSNCGSANTSQTVKINGEGSEDSFEFTHNIDESAIMMEEIHIKQEKLSDSMIEEDEVPPRTSQNSHATTTSTSDILSTLSKSLDNFTATYREIEIAKLKMKWYENYGSLENFDILWK